MDDFVLVPVPPDRVLDVYALLGRSDAARGSDKGESAGLDGWNAAMLRKHVASKSNTIKGLVKYLADHAGSEVRTEEVAEALGLERGWNSLAGALGAFGRYLTNRGLRFPWETWYDADGWTVMRMSETVAGEVRKAGL